MAARAEDIFDKDASTDEGIWQEAAARLKIADEAESQNRINGIKAKAFRWGDQWDADIANNRKIEGRPALTVNHTNVFCSRTENQLRQQQPRIKCHPNGGGATVDLAKVVQGLIRNIEDISSADVAYDLGVQNAIDIGWGYWRIISRYVHPMSFDQELIILPIRNPFTVYMDPSAVMPDGRDQNWCLISETMPRAEYKRKYPKAKNCEYIHNEAPGDQVLMWETKTHIRLAEYYRKHEVKDTLLRLSDGSFKLKSELNPNNAEIAQILDALGLQVVADRPTTRCQVQWFRLNGKEVIDSRNEPDGVYHIPVVRCEGNVLDVNGEVKRKGMVQDLIDPAQMFNYTETSKTERYALAPKAPWVMAEGQDDGHPEWNDANQKSYSRLVYKPVMGPDGSLLPPPQRQQPAQVEAGMAEWSSSAERNLMAVAGMAPENPEIQARVVSGNKYLQRRQGMQDLTHYQYYKNQKSAIAWTGELLLERIPAYYDTERQQRILGEDGVPEVITLNQQVQSENGLAETIRNNMKVGRYAIVMDTGPGYATKREENAENMMELLATPLGEKVSQVAGDVVIRNMDWPDADLVADRLAVVTPGALEKIVEGLPKQAQNVIGALQSQLQEKDQQIQQMGLEIKYKAGIQESKNQAEDQRNVRDNVTKLQIAEQDNTVKLDVEDTKAATARDVAEIHAAGQLLNTQVESREEEKSADKLIKAGTTDRK